MPRPLSEAAREKAITASQTLVAECGIDGFTMDRVAKRSGVAKTTLYRHWNSSNELLMHAIDCQVEKIPGPDTGSLRGDLTELMTLMATIVDQEGNRQLMLEVLGEAARNAEFAAVHRAMMVERHAPIREIVARAIARKEIPDIDLAMACTLVEGPFISRVILKSDPIDPAELPAIVNFIAQGLGSPNR